MYKTADATSLERLNTLFPSEDASHDFGFTLLHKTVLGLNNLKLRGLLESLSKSAIDQTDSNGRSALWWAARRGDTSAVSSLIEFDADINLKSHNGWRPLDAAIISNNLDCIWLLLRSRPKPNCAYTTSFGHTALHHCCFHLHDVDIMEWLIDRGADINASSTDGATALHIASQEGKEHFVDHLLSKGANINVFGNLGETPLHCAIRRDDHQMVRLLLHHRMNYSVETNAGETILHYAAHFANAKCLQVLASHKLPTLNLGSRVRNSPAHKSIIKGLNALEIANRRRDVSREWLALFQKLVHENKYPELRAWEDDQEEEEFNDALEHQVE